MEILIPLAIIIIVALYAVKKLKPELWKEVTLKLEKKRGKPRKKK
jgi:hypothetical protein